MCDGWMFATTIATCLSQGAHFVVGRLTLKTADERQYSLSQDNFSVSTIIMTTACNHSIFHALSDIAKARAFARWGTLRDLCAAPASQWKCSLVVKFQMMSHNFCFETCQTKHHFNLTSCVYIWQSKRPAPIILGENSTRTSHTFDNNSIKE